MESLYLLVPLSVVIVFIAIWAFFRASDTGQFDDMVGPALRILQDDDSAGGVPPAPGSEQNAERKTESSDNVG
jgi:cbb3-type cytochrome oxidase maturation protein